MADADPAAAGVDRPNARPGVIVAVHDTDRARLDRCLASLRRSDPAVRIVVVDNSGRTDAPVVPEVPVPAAGGTVEPGTVTHVATENRGFGAAINLGARHPSLVECDRLVILNDDVEVTAGWLSPLLDALDADPGLGAAQPKLLLAETDPPLVNSLGVEIDEYGAGSDIGVGTPDDPSLVGQIAIEAFTGGAVVVRRSCFDELGGFDERLFLYYEDVDLARRGTEHGWRYACVPTSVVVHAKGATTVEMGDRTRRLQERNRLVVALRFASPDEIARALALSLRRLRHRPRKAHALALGGALVRAPRALVERRRASRLLQRRVDAPAGTRAQRDPSATGAED